MNERQKLCIIAHFNEGVLGVIETGPFSFENSWLRFCGHESRLSGEPTQAEKNLSQLIPSGLVSRQTSARMYSAIKAAGYLECPSLYVSAY
jgi:hypothetical protein